MRHPGGLVVLGVRVSCWLSATLGICGTAVAQQKRPPDLPLTKAEVTAVILGTADVLERNYVDSLRGRDIAGAVRLAVHDTSFADIRSSLQLVRPMNRLLSRVGNDAHLRFGYSYLPDTTTPDRPLTPKEHDDEARNVELHGYGVRRVEMLEGGVGLLELTNFYEPEFAGEAVAGALRLLNGSDALIIDLRNNGGGDADMVRFLASYFFAEPVHLSDWYSRRSGATEQWWTLPYVPGPKYLGKQVYILTSKRTFSAAEALAYHLRQRKRAILVGEQTKGGGHTGRYERVTPHFAVYVPEGNGVDAVSHANWEGVGVTPDTAADDALAFNTAYIMALEGLTKSATDVDAIATLKAILAHAKSDLDGQGRR